MIAHDKLKPSLFLGSLLNVWANLNGINMFSAVVKYKVKLFAYHK